MGWRERSRRIAARVADLGPLSGPSPEFRARLRAELLQEYAAERTRRTPAPPKAPKAPELSKAAAARVRAARRRANLRFALVFTVLLGAMFATGVRTHNAMPGEPLYPLKRAAESTLLSLTYDDEDLARREMALAHLRAAETACLVRDAAPQESTPERLAPERHRLIAQTLHDMEQTTRAALSHVVRRKQTTGEARRFARQQRTLVEPLLPKLDRENRDKARKYLSYIESFEASGP